MIKGERIVFKLLTQKNATKEYAGWLSDLEVNRYLVTKKATVSELKKYIREKNSDPNCLLLGIFCKDKHIGNIKLEPIDFKNLKARIGILIGDKNYWGKGIATEAIELLVKYGFDKLKLKEIDLAVEPENKPAIRVYEKVGFVKAGLNESNKLLLMSIRHGENK